MKSREKINTEQANGHVAQPMTKGHSKSLTNPIRVQPTADEAYTNNEVTHGNREIGVYVL